MINLFDYTDFTVYLKDYGEDAKKQCLIFSYRLLAEKAGLSSRWVLYRVLQKKAKLSEIHCNRLSQVMHHTRREAEYFSLIVAYAQANDENERSVLLAKALNAKRNDTADPNLIGKDYYSFFSEWYHSVIRSLVGIGAWSEDYALLGSKLVPPITAEQAKRSIALLERMGFIERENGGNYQIATAKNIKTGNEFTQDEKNRFHREYMEIAQQMLFDHAPNVQKISSTVLGISDKTYEIICKETDLLKQKIRTLVENETEADRVFLYQSIFVPLTEKCEER